MTDVAPFGVYVHVPFCEVRCGYCDFNTYTATELGPGASQAEYPQTAVTEMELARRYLLEHNGLRSATSVFFGGGTPTLLPTSDVVQMLEGVRQVWGIHPGAEISIEANPDSVQQADLLTLKEAGFTRVSFGMQSAVPHVLKTLDRTHDPKSLRKVTQWAMEVGLEFSVDLIYGTPGESLADWQASLEAAIALDPGHISAYALTIEPGTRMYSQVKRGKLEDVDPDDQAEKYELADDLLSAAGYYWYEISNWTKSDGQRSRHNLSYWLNHDWWGIGPGAHSHIQGVRFMNIKHPRPYANQIHDGELPIAEREVLTPEEIRYEEVLLGLRTRYGLLIPEGEYPRLTTLVERGLANAKDAENNRLVLTRKGRLLADSVALELLH